MKLYLFTLLVSAIILLLITWPMVRDLHRRKRVACANTFDEGVETADSVITYLTDGALSARHLLVKQGSDDAHIAVNGASDYPLGAVNNKASAAEERMPVKLLGKGGTTKMVAAGAIASGVRVFAAAGGKVRALPVGAGTYIQVGISQTKADADNDVLNVIDHPPIAVVVS